MQHPQATRTARYHHKEHKHPGEWHAIKPATSVRSQITNRSRYEHPQKDDHSFTTGPEQSDFCLDASKEKPMPCSSHQDAPQKGLISISRMRGEKELQRARNIQIATCLSSYKRAPTVSLHTTQHPENAARARQSMGRGRRSSRSQDEAAFQVKPVPAALCTRSFQDHHYDTCEQHHSEGKECEDTHERADASTTQPEIHDPTQQARPTAEEQSCDHTEIREPSISCKPAATNRLQRTRLHPTKQRPHQSAEASTMSNIKMAADVTRSRSNTPLLTRIREDPSPHISPDERRRAQKNTLRWNCLRFYQAKILNFRED